MAPRALIFVRETSGLAEFAKSLADNHGFEFAGNATACEALASKGLKCELLGAAEAEAEVVDGDSSARLLVANFVDVESAGRSFLSWKAALGAFDREIVSLIRAAAWQLDRLTVLGNGGDYEAALRELEAGKGKFGLNFRRGRATAALRAASEFDFSVAQYLEIHAADAPDMGALSGYPQALRIAYARAQNLDAGENRHQHAALYGSFYEHFELLAGPVLDYASILCVSRAAYMIGEFEKPTVGLLRRGRIFAVACGESGEGALAKVASDDFAKGAWLVCNQELGGETVKSLIEEGVAGLLLPDISESALSEFRDPRAARIVVSRSGMGYEALREIRSVAGGVLVQDKDRAAINPMEWTVQSLSQPLVEDWEPLLLAAKITRHAESAALAIVRGSRLEQLEAFSESGDQAWRRLKSSSNEFLNTVAVFDEATVSPATLQEMKAGGVRAVLIPSGPDNDALQAVANDCGLVLLTASRSFARG